MASASRWLDARSVMPAAASKAAAVNPMANGFIVHFSLRKTSRAEAPPGCSGTVLKAIYGRLGRFGCADDWCVGAREADLNPFTVSLRSSWRNRFSDRRGHVTGLPWRASTSARGQDNRE